MSYLSSLRVVRLIGLLGSALLIIGFFLPDRFDTVLSPHPSYSIHSFASTLQVTIAVMLGFATAGNTLFGLLVEILSGIILLALLIPLLTSLAMLLGTWKRATLPLPFSLGFAILGLLALLPLSALPLEIFPMGHGTVSITYGPGFWLMLVGFFLCIHSSIAQYALSRIRIITVKSEPVFESLQEETHFAAPREASFEKES